MADGKVIYEIRGDTSKLDSDIKGAESKFSGIASGIGRAVKGIAVAVAGATTAVIGSSIKIGSDFEAQMSKVQAISGATASELAKLEEQALELGASSVFSASETASAQEMLASAGFGVNEIMGAMPGLLDAAASSGNSLGNTAEVIAASLNGFGLSAEQATHVADVYAQAAANTAIDLAGMGEAMKYVAPDANALGISLEETAATIGILADAGLQGSESGTGLRSVLSSLREPSDNAKKAMMELGLYTMTASGEFDNAFYGADGKFIGMDAAVRLLIDSTANLTMEEKNNALGKMFSTQAMTSVNILMGEQVKYAEESKAALEAQGLTYTEFTGKIRALQVEYQDCDGAAAEMAKTMTDNLQGALNETSGKIETMQLRLYEGLEPALKSSVQSFNEFLEGFMADGGLDKLIEMFSGLAESLSGTLLEILPVIIELFDAFLPIFKGIAEIIPGVIDLFMQLFLPIADMVEAALPPLLSILKELLGVFDVITVIMPVIEDAFKALMGPISEIASVVADVLIEVLYQLIVPIAELIEAVMPALIDVVQIVADIFKSLAPIIKDIAQLLGDVLSGAGSRVAEVIKNIAYIVGELLKFAFEKLVPPIMELVETVFPLLLDIVELVSPIIEALAYVFSGVLAVAIEVVAGILEGLVSVIKWVISGIQTILGMPVSDAEDKVSEKAASKTSTKSGKKAQTSSIRSYMGYAKGLEEVPYDDFPALLHEGEMIMPATEAHLYRSGLTGRADGSSSSVDDHSTTVGSITINPNAQQWSELMTLLQQSNDAQRMRRAGGY